ncbi:unnamed protein product [Protopolystoma xenopodis]|uniref:Uncharacterized protein n=1 Tax=Protopolystoma xenopodis TaxID=117903 RepID=A0A3S5BSB0_9PLAT|nr:unnamed protein product [Protopolystoma xenopodis]
MTLSVFQLHQRLTSVFRPCGNYFEHVSFLDLSSFVASGGYARRYFRLAYSRRHCFNQLRQITLIMRCGCLSETMSIQVHLAPYLARLGFCHAPADLPIRYFSSDHGDRAGETEAWRKPTAEEVGIRVDCHDAVMRLPIEKVS